MSPAGEVQVVAPASTTLDQIKQVLARKMPWVDQQFSDMRNMASPPLPRQYLAGETYRYRGRSFRLRIEKSLASSVKLTRGDLKVLLPTPGNRAKVQTLVEAWYRTAAHRVFHERIPAQLPRFGTFQEVKPTGILIRSMKSRWGSMTPAGKLLLNLELIKMPTAAIDYVITHELAHRIEHHHGPEFWQLLDRVMPDWRDRKALLETSER